MKAVYYLLQCFGDRYINIDNEQAALDVTVNREELVGSFNAILDYMRLCIDD